VTIDDDPDDVKRGNSFNLNDRNGVQYPRNVYICGKYTPFV